MGWIENKFEKNFLVTTVDYVFNWARKSAIWPMTFGLACCAIEMIAASTSRFDIARFGSEVFRPSPRQSDLMIVAGTVTLKMAPVVKRIYDQMPDPKWCISMGACSSVGRPVQYLCGAAGRRSHCARRCVCCRVPAPSGEPLLWPAPPAGQDRPDEHRQEAHGSSAARGHGRQFQGADPYRAGQLR